MNMPTILLCFAFAFLSMGQVATTTFSLRIRMDSNTYNKLKAFPRNLVVMKAVEISVGSWDAKPLAWICLDPNNFGLETTVSWTESYQAYTSTDDDLILGTQITVSNSYPIALGQILHVTNPSGSGEVQSDGIPGSVTIANQQGNPSLTGGLMQTCEDNQRGTVSSPLCAISLSSNSAVTITPINKVYVAFARNIKKVGEVAEYSIHTGILLDYVDETSREIRFDIDKGFIPDHPEGSETIEATPDLARLLIISK